MILPSIPVIDIRDGGPIKLAEDAADRLRDLHRCARRRLTPPVLTLMDAASRRWFERTGNPFAGEIDAIAALLGRPGAHALNGSYEWACTSGVGNDSHRGVRLLRVLDWKLAGLGRNLVVARQRGPAGDFMNLTWPGFVGAVTAAAPGRFAAAINQPPMPSWGATLPLDWAIGRVRMWRHPTGLPPSHLLRRACETCADYRDAKRLLSEAPVCAPVFFVVAGTEPGEGCVIERHPDGTAIREMPAAIANHWVARRHRGRPRGRDSAGRYAQMAATLAAAAPFAPAAPIVNRDTRMVAAINLAAGDAVLQGWENGCPATSVLSLDISPDALALEMKDC